MSNSSNTLDKYFFSTEPYELNANNNPKSSKKNDNKTHTRSNWDPRWIKKYPWLDRQIDNQGMPELYYIWYTEYNRHSTSIFVVGTKKFKKDYLDKHIEIKEYQKAVKKFTQCQQSDQLDLMSSFTVQAGVNKLNIIAKMRCVYLYTKRHLAVEAFPDLIELTNLQVQNQIKLVYDKPPITIASPIFGPKRIFLNIASELFLNNQLSNYATYDNPKAGAEFLHAIAVVIEEDILAEKIYQYLYAIVSKHIVENIPVLRYLGLIELDETNTEAIVNNLKNFLIAKMLDTQKLMHFGSNGNKTGVATQLKEINSFITNCHCIAHRLNLVGKDLAEEVSYFKGYEFTLKEIYAYFATSHQKWKYLKLFQSLDNEDSQLSILCVVSTRWLSLSNAVSNLHQIIFSIKDALYDEALNDFCAKTRQQAKALYDNIDSEFILATKYLADLLSIISKLTKIFQSDYVALSDIYMQLNIAIESITLEFIGYEDDDIAPTCGYFLREYICDTIEYDELPSIFKEFALSFIKNLHQRFPNIENEILLLGNFYGKFKQYDDIHFLAKVNRIELLKVWRETKLVLKNYKELGFVEGWR
ncbi:10494_t:CDS:2 [Dentiscutata heterogama]|uniref:10494_t:CDS:1 n=1 Tax=Dentiscutata heterogama TaxID=1316150 RepID=A0ACA9MSC6_9GLOM|nr:10494_t:CDS:2 [Dentiscutata heterogama]